uniref:Uncharacterized protein n=1 Tax=Anguilla anguilla TaxID=7936 RepID=A0A0E9PSW4_ANGAN
MRMALDVSWTESCRMVRYSSLQTMYERFRLLIIAWLQPHLQHLLLQS